MKQNISLAKVIHLFMAGTLIVFSSGVTAKIYTSEKTATIKGIAPYFNKVGAVGSLQEGETLEILASGDKAQYQFIDEDGDTDNSSATITWFLLDGDTIVAGSEKTGSQFTIPTDGSAVDKRVGFRITPLSSTGDPDRSRELTVMDVTKLGGQNPQGEPGGEDGKPNNSINGPGGVIRPGKNIVYEIQLLDKEGKNIISDNINPQVRNTYTAKIMRKDNGQDYTARYQSSLTWSLVESAASGEPTVTPLPALNGQTQFITQTSNSNAKAKHSVNQSEQGLSIMVSFDDGNDAVADKPKGETKPPKTE
ncbi:MAG: hypothetical protein ACRC5A_07820 [Enterobacteriaceae bacterium]